MLGPIGANVMKLLKVLTPQDIEGLTKSADRQKNKVSAAAAKKVGVGSDSERSVATAFSKRHEEKQSKQNQEDQGRKNPEVIPLFINSDVEEEEVVYKQAAGAEYSQDEIQRVSTSEGKKSQLESIGILSQDKIAELENERKRKAKAKEPSATIFLINERTKLKASNSKIHGQGAIRSYKSSASLDIKVEEKLEEEGKSNLSTGILLDKKQF